MQIFFGLKFLMLLPNPSQNQIYTTCIYVSILFLIYYIIIIYLCMWIANIIYFIILLQLETCLSIPPVSSQLSLKNRRLQLPRWEGSLGIFHFENAKSIIFKINIKNLKPVCYRIRNLWSLTYHIRKLWPLTYHIRKLWLFCALHPLTPPPYP